MAPLAPRDKFGRQEHGRVELVKVQGSGRNRSCSGHSGVGGRIGHYPLRVRLFQSIWKPDGEDRQVQRECWNNVVVRMFLVIGR